MPARKAATIENTVFYGPQLLAGNDTLVTVISFKPIPKRTRKASTSAVEGQEKPKFSLPVPSVNELINLYNAEAYRLSARFTKSGKQRRGNSATNFIQKWRRYSKKITDAHLKNNGLGQPLLKCARVVVEIHWPDYRIRDSHNLFIKPIMDGFEDAGLFFNDSGVIRVEYGLGAVDRENPRVDFYIYQVSLSEEDMKLIPFSKSRPVTRKRASKN